MTPRLAENIAHWWVDKLILLKRLSTAHHIKLQLKVDQSEKLSTPHPKPHPYLQNETLIMIINR